jgi:hypothetical protein
MSRNSLEKCQRGEGEYSNPSISSTCSYPLASWVESHSLLSSLLFLLRKIGHDLGQGLKSSISNVVDSAAFLDTNGQ